MKQILLSATLIALFCMPISAQNSDKFELGITGGSTGIGVEISAPINQMFRVRAGYTFMPKITKTANFGVELEDLQTYGCADRSQLDKLLTLFAEATGQKLKDNIDMQATPSFNNLKLLVDVYPFKNKKFYVTTGFYYGSSTVANIKNTEADIASLMAINIYNYNFDKITHTDEDGFPDPIPVLDKNNNGIISYELPGTITEKVLEGKYGHMYLPVGKYKNGESYKMYPTSSNTVTCKVKVNKFRPYLGFGYGDKFGINDKYCWKVDAGMMFWGGTPSVITHDGTDIAKDIVDINGKLGRYVKQIKAVKAYPVVEFKICKRL